MGELQSQYPEVQSLDLNGAQRLALAAVHAFAEAVVGLAGNSDPEAVLASPSASLALNALRASAAALAPSLPDCPYAPAGAGWTDAWESPPPAYRHVFRCSHDPAHCLYGAGGYVYQCPP